MIAVLDPCDLGTTANEEGLVIQIQNVEGLTGMKVLLPINWETWDQLVEGADKQRKLQGPRIHVAHAGEVPHGA